MFFNILKDIFKSIEGLLTSGKVQIGSKGEGIVVLAGLRKKIEWLVEKQIVCFKQ